MRKSDLINNISDKTGIPKVDVLVTVETLIKEIKGNISKGENIYIRGLEVSSQKKGLQRSAGTSRKMWRCIFRNTTYLHSNHQKNL